MRLVFVRPGWAPIGQQPALRGFSGCLLLGSKFGVAAFFCSLSHGPETSDEHRVDQERFADFVREQCTSQVTQSFPFRARHPKPGPLREITRSQRERRPALRGLVKSGLHATHTATYSATLQGATFGDGDDNTPSRW